MVVVLSASLAVLVTTSSRRERKFTFLLLASAAVFAFIYFTATTEALSKDFTEDGLHAFGRAKRVICMDGFDLYEVLECALPLETALAAKVRAAAETGLHFHRIRALFTT